MGETAATRSEQLATELEATIERFRRLVESLTAEQWLARGANYPQRLNDEDEGRAAGVIAHHVAANGDFILERIQATLAGRPLAPLDFKAENAAHAHQNAAVGKAEVLELLRESAPRLAAAVRAIPDDRLDEALQTPAGPLTIEARIQRVLIGHVKSHQGSIEAAIR
jgi:hypothetical protein